jgi:hypothetical protein
VHEYEERFQQDGSTHAEKSEIENLGNRRLDEFKGGRRLLLHVQSQEGKAFQR